VNPTRRARPAWASTALRMWASRAPPGGPIGTVALSANRAPQVTFVRAGKVFYASAGGFTMQQGFMEGIAPKCSTTIRTTKTPLCHYFEWTRPEPTTEAWCNLTTKRLRTNHMFGFGFSNTSLMARECTSGAGVTVWNSESGGVNDWFLPSIEELKLLKSSNYGGRLDVAPGQTGALQGAWSSSEDARDDSDWNYRGRGCVWTGVYFLNFLESLNNPLPLGDRTVPQYVIQVRAF